MKLLDILQERRSVPEQYKIDTSVLKEYIFKDWQIFNQKVVPSFKLLRNRIVKESYNARVAKNNIMGIVEFAAKKYIAECTNRKYLWNEMFPKEDRYRIANELLEFFEKYNLDDNLGLLTEQESSTREAKITFEDIEAEVEHESALLILNFNYDEATTNFITNILSTGKGVKLGEVELAKIQALLKCNIKDLSGEQQMSYLKLKVDNTNISRTDLKRLSGGAFYNRIVTLDVIQNSNNEEPSQENPENAQQPETAPPATQPQAAEPPITNAEIKEIVMESINKYRNYIRS